MVRLARYEWEKNLLNLAVVYTEPGLVGQCKSDPFLEAACFSGQSFGDQYDMTCQHASLGMTTHLMLHTHQVKHAKGLKSSSTAHKRNKYV